MAKRLVKKGVTVVREGKRVRPEIGKNFDFTADEIERITASIRPLSRRPMRPRTAKPLPLRRPPRRRPRPTSRCRTDETAKAAGKAAGKSDLEAGCEDAGTRLRRRAWRR
jgi:hypothetical protein